MQVNSSDIVRKKMNNKAKSIGTLLAGIGIFLIGISAIIFALKGCTADSSQNEMPTAQDFDKTIDNAKKALNDPELQKMMQENLKKALSEVKVEKVETTITK